MPTKGPSDWTPSFGPVPKHCEGKVPFDKSSKGCIVYPSAITDMLFRHHKRTHCTLGSY